MRCGIAGSQDSGIVLTFLAHFDNIVRFDFERRNIDFSAIHHEMAMADAVSAPTETSGEEPVSAPQLEPVLEPVAIGRDEPEPAIKPIVIGNGEAPVAERKRGWWRR